MQFDFRREIHIYIAQNAYSSIHNHIILMQNIHPRLKVLAKFDFVPQFFAVLFFLMLITLGLGSAVGFISAVTTTIYDSFPDVDQKFILKICCCVGKLKRKRYIKKRGNVTIFSRLGGFISWLNQYLKLHTFTGCTCYQKYPNNSLTCSPSSLASI